MIPASLLRGPEGGKLKRDGGGKANWAAGQVVLQDLATRRRSAESAGGLPLRQRLCPRQSSRRRENWTGSAQTIAAASFQLFTPAPGGGESVGSFTLDRMPVPEIGKLEP